MSPDDPSVAVAKNPGQPKVVQGNTIAPFSKKDVFSRSRLNELVKAVNCFLRPHISRGDSDQITLSDGGWLTQIAGAAGVGTGGLVYRGQYDATQTYNVNDLVYTFPDANTRIPWVCLIANSSASPQAPTWPEPGTVYWRDIARFFFDPSVGVEYRVGIPEGGGFLIQDQTSTDVWCIGQFRYMDCLDVKGTTFHALRNAVILLTAVLNPRPASWFCESHGVDNNTNFSSTGSGTSCVVNGSGQLYLAGKFDEINSITTPPGSGGNYSIQRINKDGTVDEAWTAVGGANGFINAILIDTGTSNIMIGGSFTGWNGGGNAGMTRLTTGAANDGTFTLSSPLPGIIHGPYAMIQNGGIFFVGMLDATRDGIWKIDGSGTRLAFNTKGEGDNSGFTKSGGFSPDILALAFDGSGNLLVGGDFDGLNGVSVTYIVRLTSLAARDTAFSCTLNGIVKCVIAQGDGKIIIAGSFSTVNGTSHPYIARLNSDGSLDTGFDVQDAGTHLNNQVQSVIRKSNGEYLFAGLFTSPRSGVGRCDASGNILGI